MDPRIQIRIRAKIPWIRNTDMEIFFLLLANSKQNSKRLKPVNQGPRGYCLMKKIEG
jgi:hypothetical protein